MTIESVEANVAIQPTVEQKERLNRLKRFNWLFVYLPMLIFVLIIAALIGVMVWGVFSPQNETHLLFLSGLADLILIMILLPTLLLCALGPAALGGLIYFWNTGRKTRKEALLPVEGLWLQRQLWRLEGLIDKGQSQLNIWLPRIVQPVIQVNGWLAYVQQWLMRIRKMITRSD